ncbi:hypothetical protein [Adhaeribacter arboris]|nr:hypothetical protein [Adhaeribacter arboris]
MDKEQRRKLSQEYKRKDLEKYLESGNSILVNYAKVKLGLNSKLLKSTDIFKIPDEQLIEVLNDKIEETAEKTYRENPQLHKSSENVLKSFPSSYRLVYYTRQFEMLTDLGDGDKFFENTPKEEIEIVAESYDLIGFKSFSSLIREVSKNNQKLELVENEYAVLKITIDKSRIEFIRKNALQFEIK